MSKAVHNKDERRKYSKLILSVLFDLIGVMTYAVPFFGEAFDLFWAPLSAILIWLMYRKTYGSIGGIFGFFEEILPGSDIVPSFTIMWVVKYYLLSDEYVSKEVTVQ